MKLRLKGELKVDNLRNYPAEVLERLRGLLATGVEARPDPRRYNFYVIEDSTHLFYIHITPRGKVLLLAARPLNGHAATVIETELLAQPSY